MATPTREQLAKLDRKRVKKGSNDDWVNPHDPEAEITELKDGRTRVAYEAEHAVDLETGAVVAVTVAGGAAGDTETILETLPQAGEHIAEVARATNQEAVGERVVSTNSTPRTGVLLERLQSAMTFVTLENSSFSESIASLPAVMTV